MHYIKLKNKETLTVVLKQGLAASMAKAPFFERGIANLKQNKNYTVQC